MVHKGFNSDLNFKGKSYHIQTEDWGLQNPFIVSRIFCNGAVIKTIKTPYDNFLKTGSSYLGEAIKNALKRQHSDVMDLLLNGQL